MLAEKTELFMFGSRINCTLYIMRGIPGCGKSHRAEELVKELDASLAARFDSSLSDHHSAIICSADHYFGTGEEYKKNWHQSKAHLGHRDCEAKVLAAMKARKPNIIVDNTNLALAGFRTYLDYALDNDYSVHFVYPDSPWWVETVEPFLRNKKTDDKASFKAGDIAKMLYEKNVHGVPEATLIDMLLKFQWVSYDDYVEATAQRVKAVEKELADMKARFEKLENKYL